MNSSQTSELAPVRYLITGGAGFIGSALIRHLITQTDHSVINLDKLSYAANLHSLDEIDDSQRYTFEQGDICDQPFVKGIFKDYQPDAVIHLAGESHVDRSIQNPDLFITSNVVGTQVVLDCAKNYWHDIDKDDRFRFLYVSTEEIYGGRKGEETVDETAPYRPNSPYAGSKAAATNLVQTYRSTYGLPVLVTCSSNNYGPWQHPEKLIPATINNAINGLTIPIYGQGHDRRSWLYVDDHVRALLCILENGHSGQSYNINGSHETENIELVTQICNKLDQYAPAKSGDLYSALIQLVDDRPGHDRRYGLDDSRIRKTLGWRAQESFEDGLDKTISWNLKHMNIKNISES